MANPFSSARVRERRRKGRRGHPCDRESAAVPIQPVPGHQELVRGSELAQASLRLLLPDNVPPAVPRGPDSAMFPEA